MMEEMEKHVQNIKKCSNTTPDNETHMSLSNGNETMDHTPIVDNLLEKVKGFKKKEGRKGGKHLEVGLSSRERRKQKLQEMITWEKSYLR
jgi:ribosomal protein L1